MRQLEVAQSIGSSTAMWKEKESTTLKFLVKQCGGGFRKRRRCRGSRSRCFGLGTRNERGDRLVDFCKQHDMTITNT